MKTLLVVSVALLGGFVAGLLLSELIGVAGVLVFGQVWGIKYLPVYLALAAGAIALVVDLLVRGKPR